MTKVLVEADIDPTAEIVDQEMTAAETDEANAQFERNENLGDLSDGGIIGGAKLTPMAGGKKLLKGRPAARRAWMWNGTESLLPLAWNPEGTRHDGARKYLLKRHCLCCRTGGFTGERCLHCIRSRCVGCGASTDRSKIIRCFYLRKEDVPFPERFYGSIDCFLSVCVRRGSMGFKTEPDMRLHARSRHRMEYQAYIESTQAAKQDEIGILRQQVNALLLNSQATVTPVPDGGRRARGRPRK